MLYSFNQARNVFCQMILLHDVGEDITFRTDSSSSRLRGMNYVGNLTMGRWGEGGICAKVTHTHMLSISWSFAMFVIKMYLF